MPTAARPSALHRMRFVGADTGKSSILTLFPVWSQMLGLDAELLPLDIPIGAPAGRFRDAVTAMRSDGQCVGALVTTHKISLYAAARDLFDEVDPFGTECGEVSSIAFRDGRTLGAAKDPITAGLSLREFLSDNHFADGAQVLCLGAGGAGTAIGWYLAQRRDAPSRLTFVDTAADRLDHLAAVVAPHATRSTLETLRPDEVDISARLGALPSGSVVINATGMGKERPGSPVPGSAVFPADAVVWDLNYRGSLEFLVHARTQEQDRRLTVVDGWRYFIHGWTQVIAEVFGIPMPPERVEELAAAADGLRR
ncbi:shikimate dehydrogenase [Nakamurella sp. A5-74]|uniref:Shikimate dehydrogenase n=1 Tax=Nakamurella sp. A5-74 TaxID=3158264 RepID=A0AAU8DN32_9ACTN